MEGGGWAQRSRPPDPSFLHGPGQGQQHHTAHTSPFGVWPLKSRSSVLGLTWSGQRGRRDWRSEAVEVFLYTRNCMEMMVSSSRTPRLPTSQGRWCRR